jgi:hypothetical protein
MTRTQLSDGLERIERRLFATPVIESFIARREIGIERTDDLETGGALARELVASQGANGSWADNLALTAETALLLTAVRPFDQGVEAALTRVVAWLRSRQRTPGSFVDHCTPDLHEAGLCRHFAGGFFSPGPRSTSLAGTTLSNGALLSTDSDARLGLSALALRVVLGLQTPTQDDLIQVDALRRMTDFLFRDTTRVANTAALMVVAALLHAPRSADTLATVHDALARLAGQQRADGSWLGADPFHVVELLLLAARSGYRSPFFDAAVARTAEILVLTQRPDGSWGTDAEPYRLLTGWRTLRYVVEHQS